MGQIPYGYRIENGAAVIVPEEAAQIRLIFSKLYCRYEFTVGSKSSRSSHGT